jgi:hypothetical protein
MVSSRLLTKFYKIFSFPPSNLLHMDILTISGDKHKLRSFLLSGFFQPLATSPFSDPNILNSILFSDRLNLLSPLNIWDLVLYPYKTKGKTCEIWHFHGCDDNDVALSGLRRRVDSLIGICQPVHTAPKPRRTSTSSGKIKVSYTLIFKTWEVDGKNCNDSELTVA